VLAIVGLDQVPSKFWLAGMLLNLDKKLLRYSGGESNKVSASIADAEALKSQIQYLRGLVRHTPMSRDPTLYRMKSMIKIVHRDEPMSSPVSSTAVGTTTTPTTSPPSLKRTSPEGDHASLVGGVVDEVRLEDTLPPDFPDALVPAAVSAPVASSDVVPSRTRHLGKRPCKTSPSDIGSVTIATPLTQRSLAAEGPPAKTVWSLDVEVECVGRVVPPNFSTNVHKAFLCLPEVCLPQGACKGKHNFSIKDKDNRVVQVHLMNKACGGVCVHVLPSVPKLCNVC
jgi:hypothetical protein